MLNVRSISFVLNNYNYFRHNAISIELFLTFFVFCTIRPRFKEFQKLFLYIYKNIGKIGHLARVET